MAKVVYRPETDMPESTEQFGYSFEKGKSVDVTDAQHLRKFSGNRFFEMRKAGDPLKAHNL